MIDFRHKGNFLNSNKLFEKCRKNINLENLDKYGQEGVAALSSATPINTGLTANSWYYKIVKDRRGVSIQFHNSNIQNEVLVAVVIQYGHGTRNGSWVQGTDYINPTIKPIFENITTQVWKEVLNRE